jgi:TonB-dependent SusC/RagA subfamily outer membrane receptor
MPLVSVPELQVRAATPFVLIGGMLGTLNTVAPEGIQSIDVLKDGLTTAIYGTRGTNGIILITTSRHQAHH